MVIVPTFEEEKDFYALGGFLYCYPALQNLSSLN